MSHRVVFFVYPGFVLLDLSGPLDALAVAEEMAPGSYELTVVSLDGGLIESSSRLKVLTEPAATRAADTFIVVGAPRLPREALVRDCSSFIRMASSNARRTASVCTGAFLLAASGLLDGRRATTHWRYAPRLKAIYPAVRVDGDRIFVNDDGIWTSAGMTAGVDMVLALIEEDLGRATARAVARMLVVYYRRPGGQDQYSSLLDLDPESDRIGRALRFARKHLSDRLSVKLLSEAAHMSVRHFGRAFVAATGLTPARAIERLRVEVARPRVEDGREAFDTIAQATGFADPERMRQSFVRILGHTPQELRRLSRSGRMQEEHRTTG